uniref:RdRp n=1 Tax=viral metagenome TaxID=1070528 RepID=A0A2V0RC49_9ZZZZ
MSEILTLTQAQIDKLLNKMGQSNASGLFERLRLGQPPTPRTPLYKDLSEDEIFDKWTGMLADFVDRNPICARLAEYDISRMSKVGPQGGLQPFSKRENDFFDYYKLPKNENFEIDLIIIEEMKVIMFGDLKDRRPIALETVVEQDRKDGKLITSSGAPSCGRRSDPAIIEEALNIAKSEKVWLLAMILGSRSQRGKERFIFIAPFALNILEKSFLYPLMDAIRSRNINFFSAWEGIDRVSTGFMDQNFFETNTILCQQDYTSMDKYINKTCIDIVYLSTKEFFQKKYHTEYRKLLDHLLTIGVMINVDKLVTGVHGMPSGSGFTNFVESVVSLYVSLQYPETESQGLGDDLALSFPVGIDHEDIKKLITSASNSVGLIVNPDKQRIDDDTIVFLQRFYDKELITDGIVEGNYPSILALNTAINPERYHDPRKWSGKMEILRWIMILENCKNLPYFEELVQFFINGDKFKLGISLPDFFVMLPKLYDESKLIKGFTPTYNQENANRGINDFATVKLLKEIATSG